jgi:hypothetical protein
MRCIRRFTHTSVKVHLRISGGGSLEKIACNEEGILSDEGRWNELHALKRMFTVSTFK